MLPSSSSPTLPTVFFESQNYLNLTFFKGISSKSWAYHNYTFNNPFRIIAKLMWLLRDILENSLKKVTFHTYLITKLKNKRLFYLTSQKFYFLIRQIKAKRLLQDLKKSSKITYLNCFPADLSRSDFLFRFTLKYL